MEKEKLLNENEIESATDTESVLEDPDVIQINDNDYERVNDHDDEEDSSENFFERFFGKRPSEKALKKLAIASFIFGVLSCSLCLGNLVTSVLGILLAVKNEKHRYRSFFSTAGFILSAIGLILGAIITAMTVLISVALLMAIFMILALLLAAILFVIIVFVIGVGSIMFI